jgi:hypothetical protein
MLEYREKAATGADSDEGSPSEPQGQAAHPGNRDSIGPKYMALAAQYGLNDDMNIGDSSENEQTVEQEYQAYITAQCSLKSIDILKFWEVGCDTNSA